MAIIDVLRKIRFGQQTAEAEHRELAHYFVETHAWLSIYSGDSDIIYGPKGTGKSALYSLLQERKLSLRNRGVELIAAENPRGDVAFDQIEIDPPTDERQFIDLWKMYCLILVGFRLRELKLSDSGARTVVEYLEEANLLPAEWDLRSMLNRAFRFVKAFAVPKAIEGGVKLDPTSGLPSGITGKIVLRDTDDIKISAIHRSVDSLLAMANQSFASSDKIAWIIFDRLDVAFSEHQQLEENALRALFKVYLDFSKFDQIKLKVFLRTDIWSRITRTGFREASHITKQTTLKWDRAALLNLIVKRMLKNECLVEMYGINPAAVLNSLSLQEEFFYMVFPDQIERGARKSKTIDWLLSRTSDGTTTTAPREVIHFLNSLRDEQIRALEQGESEPEEGAIFSGPVLKKALSEVSRTRLEQTIYAEYPELKTDIENLRLERTNHTNRSLSKIWEISLELAAEKARKLISIGFFEPRGTKTSPEYWVPFLYRPALDMIQGNAEK